MSDWQPLNANYYTNGGVNFGLLYNKTTGDFQIKQRDILGGFNSPGLSVLYQNGRWYSDALRIPDLFTYPPGDILQSNPIPTNKAKSLNLSSRKDVYQAYRTLGGSNSGIKINSAALPQNQSGAAGVTNAVPGAAPGISSSIPGLSAPPGGGGILDVFSPGLIPNPEYKPIKSPATAIKEILKYPIDMIADRQDTLKITEIIYKPPAENLFQPGSNLTEILTKGLQRGSVKKDTGAVIILPIPNNAQDSNNVAWGEDNMNALTTAAASTIINNPGAAAGGLGLSAILNKIPGLDKFGDIINKAPQAGLLGSLINQGMGSGAGMNMIKSSLYSFILGKYGFEVTPESILARGLGVAPNSNLQLLFNNVKLRSFNFSYMLSPRSREEAKLVNKILRTFKQGMAAKKDTVQAGGPSLFLGTPNVFKLEYVSGGAAIKGMNKFKVCALTGFAVNYSPTGQWAAYDSGQPASVVMTMNFQEVEPIYDTDYQDNISDELTFELPKVGPDEVGY